MRWTAPLIAVAATLIVGSLLSLYGGYLIDTLRSKQDKVDTAMIYLSDHGESLGEYGLFLHGMPYSIAPQEQTRVPMVMWLSRGFAQDFKVNVSCLKARAAQPAAAEEEELMRRVSQALFEGKHTAERGPKAQTHSCPLES